MGRGSSRRHLAGNLSKLLKSAVKEKLTAIGAVDQAEEVEPLVSALKLNYTLDTMVQLANEGKSISRDALVGAGVTNQAYWNLANHILKVLGFRKEKTTKWFGSGDDKEDIRFIRKNMGVVDEIVLMRVPGRVSWHRVDLEEANYIVP